MLDTAQPSESLRDWPNEAGFQTLHEERSPVELVVTGQIPGYAAGVLYRTGPTSYKTKTKDGKEFSCSHWFDGFGHTHRFEIVPQAEEPTKVIYNSRRANDNLIEKVKDTGRLGHISFGQKSDPCIGIFGKIMTAFTKRRDPSTANISVAVKPNMPGLPIPSLNNEKGDHASNVKSLWATSDTTTLKSLDPRTLEPIGLASQKTLHPLLSGPLSCAHAQTDPQTGDIFNYNLDFGRFSTYRVFKTSAQTGQTEIIATISGAGIEPAYIHSFFMTQDFLVLCIWESHIGGMGLKILLAGNILDAIAPFDGTKSTKWFVIDRRHGRGVVAEFESPGVFSFHAINAWQEIDEAGKTNIICTFPEYQNLDILHSLYYTNLTFAGKDAITFQTEKGESSLPNMVQYRLSDISMDSNSKKNEKHKPKPAQKVFTIPKRVTGDLPTINPRFATKPNRYVYSLVNRGLSTFVDGISRIDLETKEVIYWDNPKGHTPGEAIFVPDPQGQREDEGVLLSVVLDGEKGTSYLVCLDAGNLAERGRADCAWPVGFGFHGVHVPA